MDMTARKEFYARADRETLERMAAFYREQLRLIEAEIIKHPPPLTPILDNFDRADATLGDWASPFGDSSTEISKHSPDGSPFPMPELETVEPGVDLLGRVKID